jgi:hypothetical protein
MLFKIPVILFIFLVNLFTPSICWGHTGHMLIATVTKLTLLKESNRNLLIFLDRDAYNLADKLASNLNIFSHNTVTNFIESACWPDDIKGYGLISMDNWHYNNLPVRFDEIIANNNITFTVDDALGTIVII